MEYIQILTVFAIMLINLGTTIAMNCQTEKKMDCYHRETTALINAIQQEMKDFHGRLCAIEERNKR